MRKKCIIVGTTILLIILLTIIVFNQNINSKQSSNNTYVDDADTDNEYYTATITLGDNITIDGNGASVNDNNLFINAGGEYAISGTLTDGMIYINTSSKVILNLNGVTVINSKGAAIYAENCKKLTLNLLEGTENYFEDGISRSTTEESKGAIFANDTIKITGNGYIEVVGNYDHAIDSDDNIYIESGNITTTSVGKGLHANDDITIDNGYITVLDAEEGIESKNTLTINGGYIVVTTEDDAINSAATLTINGGYIYAYASNNDAIDSNGALIINGGVIIASGASIPEGGLDCDQNEFNINGGIVIALGGENSTPTGGSQGTILLGSYTKGTILHIEDSTGLEVITFEIPYNISNILISASSLNTEENYSIYTGGSVSSDSFYGLYENSNYSGGAVSKTFSLTSTITNVSGTTNQMGGPGGMQPNGNQPMMRR